MNRLKWIVALWAKNMDIWRVREPRDFSPKGFADRYARFTVRSEWPDFQDSAELLKDFVKESLSGWISPEEAKELADFVVSQINGLVTKAQREKTSALEAAIAIDQVIEKLPGD